MEDGWDQAVHAMMAKEVPVKETRDMYSESFLLKTYHCVYLYLNDPNC